MSAASEPLSESEVQAIRARYEELIGFVPPRSGARIDVLSQLDPETLRMQEAIRKRLMYPACFDVKTAQLMLFGMLLMPLADAARLHARAARRAGASWEEMAAVVGLAYLFRGLSAANLGGLILKELQDEEREMGRLREGEGPEEGRRGA